MYLNFRIRDYIAIYKQGDALLYWHSPLFHCGRLMFRLDLFLSKYMVYRAVEISRIMRSGKYIISR